MNFIYHKTDWDDLFNYPIIAENSSASCHFYIYKNDVTTGYIGNLYVSEEERGKGIGKELLRFVTNFAEKNGCNQLILKVKIKSWVREWYEREGFTPYSNDDEEPDVYAWYEKKIILIN